MELRPAHLLAAAVVCLSVGRVLAAETIQFDRPFVCNGERQVVTSCRNDSSSAYCGVVYPDRPLRGGMEQQKAELRGAIVSRIKSCFGSGATLASVATYRRGAAPQAMLGESGAGSGSSPAAASGGIAHLVFRWLLIALFCYVIYRAFFKKKKAGEATCVRCNKEALEAFGATREARTAAIDDVFDLRRANIELKYQAGLVKLHISRSLSAMPMREVESLRTIHHLYNLGLEPEDHFFFARFGLIWAGGKGSRHQWEPASGEFAKDWPNADRAVNIALQDLNAALQQNPEHPVLVKLQSRLVGDGDDLLPTAPLKASERGRTIANGLILGLDIKMPGKTWCYDGEGSLITVAPTRSGKTEGQVYPNVLNWKGPMVILDIKGEIYAKTSKWRKQNVGPVYRFSPLDANRTDCYNPLTAVRSDPLHLWSDAGMLADLMIVPSEGAGGNSKFFEDSARDLVQAAIAYVCVEADPAKRPMSKLLDIIHGVDWADFVSYLQARVDMPTLARAGKALAQPLPLETRATILRTAQGMLSAWMGDLVERATSKSDWQPGDFRSGSNPTLYICINFGDMESMRSVLRTIIGQHINLLTNGTPPARTEPPAPPILFLLDEMPQLKNMPPIANALVVGAGYGVKLWMFVQDVGQLKKEYPNAEGMMGNCAVRMYMNPDLADGTAQKLSDDIGFRESIVDGSRVKIVEPNVLAGEKFKDKVIVWARGMARPASLQKNFAYLDEALTARMGGL